MSIHSKITFKTFPNIKSYDEIADLMDVRDKVFTIEQKFDASIDPDAIDFRCTHIGMYLEEKPIGAARVYEEKGHGHLGRISILNEYRKHGLGKVLVLKGKEVGKNMGFVDFILEAQVQTVPFYEKCGAVVIGPEFIMDDYPHVPMKMIL